jgi:predicted transcriptional regulator of viral defense system
MDYYALDFNMMEKSRISLAGYLTRLQAGGRVSFTRGEALEATRLSDAAFLKGAARLQRKHMLFNPRHGFYVAVPPQFLSWGAPPPSWYIDDLMRHEGKPYYVGLLKAAELHGATHHAVMEFQVVTDRQLPKIRAGRSYIVFYFRKEIKPVLSAVERRKTDTGSMAVSSVELTCLDLIRYVHAVGGFDAVATALADLGDKIDGEKLAVIAPYFERATIQRLGYLLDHLGHAAAAESLHHQLFVQSAVPWVKLDPARRKDKIVSTEGEPAEKNARWRVVVQYLPEVDE